MSSLKEDAARWFVRMCGAPPDDPERGRFEAWLAASPAHAAAYAEIADTWKDLESGPQCSALAQAMKDRRTRRRLLKGGTLGLLLAGMGGGVLHYQRRNAPLWQLARHTEAGDLLGHETLQDGSTLVLNAGSAVDVRFSRSERRVALIAGEVIFDVAHEPERPFVIDSGPARITVLGTRFAVNRLAGRVRVSVDRGTVRMDGGPFWRRQHLVLEAGQVGELVAAPGTASVLQRIGRRAGTAFEFEQGMLVFERADLAEVAETLSRHRKAPVRAVPGRAGSDPRITAGVPSAGIESFIDLLPSVMAVAVRREGDEVVLSPR